VIGLERHDDPPPDQVEDARSLLDEGRVRQINELRAWAGFDESGRPVAWDYSTLLDDTAAGLPVLRDEPEVGDGRVRFV
jgi:hypothetical protein